MPLITANQFQLQPNPNAFARGLNTGQQLRGQFDQQSQQRQLGNFSQQALAGEEGALTQVAGIDPQRATQISNFLAKQSEAERAETLRQNEVLTRGALDALSLPVEQRRAFVQQKRDEFKAAGRDTTNVDIALSGDDAQFDQFLNVQAREGLTVQELAKQQFPGAVKAPTKTSLEKNLIAAGFKPGTPEFEEQVLKNINKPSGTQITIGGEKKFQEAVQKGQAATFARIGTEADAAIDANQSLSVLESIDVNTGALEPAKQGIAAFATAFGLDGSKIANISKGEAFNAEAKRIVLAVKASQKGPQTDKDEATIRSTVANLGNSAAGNQFIIDSARALNNRRIERKEFYDNFIENSGGNFKDESGQTADSAWAKFKRNTPMISSNLRTPEGLPVFFYKFEEDVRAANPDASRAEIIEAWNAQNKGVK
jgi:hypothetical protein